MKIAVASDDGRHVAAHTGRCRGFVIFEIEGSVAHRLQERANTETAHARGECAGGHEHGEGHHSHEGLVACIADCRALVTRGLGARLVADLEARGITALVTVEGDVDRAAARFAEGRLPRIEGTGCSGRA